MHSTCAVLQLISYAKRPWAVIYHHKFMYTDSMRNNSMYNKLAKPIKTKKDAFVAVGIALIILLFLDLSPLGGNIAFYTKWVECGSKPVSTKMGGGIASAGVPNYTDAPNFGFLRSLTPYFCSPEEAERAGYSANSDKYEFPHLPQGEFQESVKKSQNL